MPGPLFVARSAVAPHVHVLHNVNAFVDRPRGCYACRWYGHRVDVAVWCARPGDEHVRSQADRGCAFWQREPGSEG